MARVYRKILKIQHIQHNAPIQIGNMRYTYDKAGNPTSILDASGIGKDLEWNADNQLRSIVDTEKGLFHSYAYDHTGERILKRYGTAQSGYVNGKNVETLYDFGESYSAYASAYFVENNNGYTKHYYAGATRLVSKIGEDYYENNELVPTGKEEKKQYFYFQDHLGSSTYITDLNGDIAQYSAYTPYGEMFREYRNVTPYRFNGKELDTETGLYYYGARYYNPATALWLGVDPLASKYPGLSPYVYCHSNPINRIDPDGRADFYLNNGELLGNDGNDDGRIFLLNDNNIYKDFDFETGGKLPSPLASKLYESSEEVDGLIIQKRVEEGADYTISEFHTVGINANTSGFILEPGGPSTTEINQNKRIPEGVYNIKPHSGKIYKNTYKLYNSDVPERRAILYHAGNTPNDTRGCNLPGKTRGEGTVYNSRKALDEIKTFISSQSGNNIKTIITNRIR